MAVSVLLIDDDVDVLRSIGNYFEKLGYEVTRELSGEAGLATFDRLRPEVVILDLRLPGMDGLEVLEHLRQRDAAVILLTGESDVATAVRAMQLGAENFLTKPVDMEHLAAATARVADKARLQPAQLTFVIARVRDKLSGRGATASIRWAPRRACRTSLTKWGSWPRASGPPCSSPARAAPARGGWRG